MKKPSSSIRIEKPAGGKPAGPGALPGGVVFLAGLWAGVWQWLHPAGSLAPAVLPIAAAVTALCLGLLVRWEKPGRLAALAAVPLLCKAARDVRKRLVCGCSCRFVHILLPGARDEKDGR